MWSDFDLGPLVQGQINIASLFLVLEVWDGKATYRKSYELGIFLCGRIGPWAPPSRSNEDNQT